MLKLRKTWPDNPKVRDTASLTTIKRTIRDADRRRRRYAKMGGRQKHMESKQMERYIQLQYDRYRKRGGRLTLSQIKDERKGKTPKARKKKSALKRRRRDPLDTFLGGK